MKIQELMEAIKGWKHAHSDLAKWRAQARAAAQPARLVRLKKDGSEFPVEIGLNPIETDEETMVLSAIVDISDRKSRELRLQETLKEKEIAKLMGQSFDEKDDAIEEMCTIIAEEMGEALVRAPMGTGPFKFKEWVPDDHLTVVRNDDYWQDPAYLDEVIFKPIPDSDARPSWAHPVILDGKLYLREQDAILCYDIKAG